MIDVKDLKFDEKTTQEFTAKNLNVLVFQNVKTNKRLYLKPVRKDGEFVNLTPLSKEELSDIGIIEESISETINGSELFDINNIEESVSENDPVQPLRKVANFDVTNAESMKAARQLADEQLKKLEEAETGKQMFTKVKSSLEEKYHEEELNPPKVTNMDEMNDASLIIKKIKDLKAKIPPTSESIPAGCVPLSACTPAKTSQEGFSSLEAMIDETNKPENKDVRNKLLHKVLSGVIQGKLSLPSYQEPEKETTTSEFSEDLRLVKKPDICGINHAYREKRLRALADSGNQEALAILNSGNY